MNPAQFQLMESIFERARELPADAQEIFVQGACGSDSEVCNKVLGMLSVYRIEDVTLCGTSSSHGVADVQKTRSSDHDSVVAPRFDRYHVIKRLGRGGMGEVFLAQQEKPRREVAIKAIRPGLISPRIRRRFELEAEVLGKLVHPGIAQIYEAGVSDSDAGSQPYFAMEYVVGKDLIEYAREHALSTRAILTLFARICDAVQHAHLKGIIHRDLKPANILVDDAGRPKILDFGIARATDMESPLTTMHTDIGQLLGTLGYMSPEQVAADPLELDARSDVYSLGICLYELLAGQPPYNVKNKLIHEVLRIVREDEPTPLGAVNRKLRGDIETIVRKALEKERDRRYQSAFELSEDIRRYLRDEPLTARPPSALYQFRHFVKRNRALVAGSSLALIALLVGLTVSFALYLTAQDAWKSEQLERIHAQRQARIAEAVSGFLNDDVLAAIDPENLQGRDLTIRDLFDQASIDIDSAFPDEPLVEAAVRYTLGSAYLNLAEFDKAHAQMSRAFSLRVQMLGEADKSTLEARVENDWAVYMNGHSTNAQDAMQTTLVECQSHLGNDDPITLRSMNNLAVVYSEAGQYANAVELYELAHGLMLSTLGANDAGYLLLLSNFGSTLVALHRYIEAEIMLQESLNGRLRIFGEDHPRTMESQNALGDLYYRVGKREKAAELFRDLVTSRTRVLGADDPRTLTALNNLAVALKGCGRVAESRPIYEHVLQARRQVLGDDHPNTLVSMNNMAGVYRREKKYVKAEALYRETLDRRRQTLGAVHPDTALSLENLAYVSMKQEHFAEAEQLLRESVGINVRIYGAAHPIPFRSRRMLADSLLWQEKYDEARTYYDSLLTTMEELQVATSELAQVHKSYGELLLRLNLFDESEAHLLRALEAVGADRFAPKSVSAAIVQLLIEVSQSARHPEQVLKYECLLEE